MVSAQMMAERTRLHTVSYIVLVALTVLTTNSDENGRTERRRILYIRHKQVASSIYAFVYYGY